MADKQPIQSINFERAFEPCYGEAVAWDHARSKNDPSILRMTAPNSGPFTFHGTNSYLIGDNDLTLIDPGPDLADHEAAIIKAVNGRRVAQILITHTHIDHTPLAKILKAKFNCPVLGCAPHHAARPLQLGEINPLDASADRDYQPDHVMIDGDVINTSAGKIRAVTTPGHTANHLCFALEDAKILFSGDHVMAWATSIVAPPDGAMSDYMASLDRLLARDDQTYLPGHGGAVLEPHKFVRGLRAHRKMRSRAILARLSKGDDKISQIVKAIYADLDPRLHGAAALSVFAHLEELVENGQVQVKGAGHASPQLASHYALNDTDATSS